MASVLTSVHGLHLQRTQKKRFFATRFFAARYSVAVLFVLCCVMLHGFSAHTRAQQLKLPYKQLGFTEQQAAAYALDKLAFGARTGEVERVAQQGVAAWIEAQLQANLPETALQERLKKFETLALSIETIAKTYPNPGMILAQAKRDGMNLKEAKGDSLSKPEYRKQLLEYAQSKGYKPQKELLGEMYAQKILRAVYAENQLAEVLTDFWFNHFNVSITDNQARPFVSSYERDAIRPNVLGKFRVLVGATAKHPAMLQYLDNAQSTAPDSVQTTASLAYDKFRDKVGPLMRDGVDKAKRRLVQLKDSITQEIPPDFRPRRGINENYARELMELHTLGVDGGYTQKDVTEAARVLTGWSIFPIGQGGEKFANRFEKNTDRLERAGFVRQEAFLFRADAHDATEKTVLGVRFEAGGGIEEGEKLLDIVSQHPATAAFICTKLARRFVSDTPPAQLVARLAEVFKSSGGDIRAVMRSLVESPEFWSPEQFAATPAQQQPASASTGLAKASAKGGKKSKKAAPTPANTPPQASTLLASRAKIKSPFELAVSSLRALDADVERPRAVLDWISKIGQPLYAYQAPTGFPDRAESWINTGSLLNRMNFGLALALGKVGGVKCNLAALNGNREPESAEDALQTYAALLLQGRNTTETLRLLKPIVAGATTDPTFAERLDDAAAKQKPALENNGMMTATANTASPKAGVERNAGTVRTARTTKPQDPDDAAAARLLDAEEKREQGDKQNDKQSDKQEMKPQKTLDASAIAQVVGIILGSPEFQRR